jgi:filamentous hemagglutinin family protein
MNSDKNISFIFLLYTWVSCLHAQTLPVQVDTTTLNAAGAIATGNTSATIAASGHVTVSVNTNLTDNDVSHNLYRAFNIPKAGMTVDNSAAFARTIIHEVTSTQRSLLEGRMDIIGRRANTVIANPNGISVNGAVFNTADNLGSVALATGTVSYDAVAQEHTVHVRQGDILIEGGGLSSTLAHLELLAKSVKVDGPISNANADVNARIKIAAGEADHKINTNLRSGDASVDFTVQTGTGASDGALLLDITRAASLSGSRIELAVTDQGAGVRHMGGMAATAGNFVLTSDGHVEVTGGQISAQSEALLRAAALTIDSDSAEAYQQSRITSASSGVYINVDGDFSNSGGYIEGKQKISAAPWNAVSQGAITLIAGGNVTNTSYGNQPMAVLFGSAGDVLIQSTAGYVHNHASRILANGVLNVSAATEVTNDVTWLGAADAGTEHAYQYREHGDLWNLFRPKTVRGMWVDYGQLQIPGQLAYLVGQAGVVVTAPKLMNLGSEINADNGAINVKVDELYNEAYRVGSTYWERSCRWWCQGVGGTTAQFQGGVLNAGTSMTVTAGQSVTNYGGRLLAIKDLTISAPQITGTSKRLTTAWQQFTTGGDLLSQYIAFFRRQDQGGSFIANMGTLTFYSANPVRLEGGVAQGALALNAAGGVDQVEEPVNETNFEHRRLGLLEFLFR